MVHPLQTKVVQHLVVYVQHGLIRFFTPYHTCCLQNCSSLSLYGDVWGVIKPDEIKLCQLGYRLMPVFAVPDLECCIDELCQ